MALPAYRHLLRSITIAFRSDTRLLTSALSTARSSFESSRSLPPTDLPAKIAHAEEVALILRRNVVQGVADGEKFRGIDGLMMIPRDRVYTELRIHDDIEKGSNETIKAAGRSLMGAGMDGGCCGGGATSTAAPAAR